MNGFRYRRRCGSIPWIDGKLLGMGEEPPKCSLTLMNSGLQEGLILGLAFSVRHHNLISNYNLLT